MLSNRLQKNILKYFVYLDKHGFSLAKHETKINFEDIQEVQTKYYKEQGTTLRGMMDNHNVSPDYFLEEVHKLDYSIVEPNLKLNKELSKLKGNKIIYTNANLKHAKDVLSNNNKIPQINESISVINKDIISDAEVKTAINDIKSDLTINRVLVRPSGTENKIRIMIESENKKTAKKYTIDLIKLFESKTP